MKKIITLIALLAFTYGISRAQVHDTIVKWTFPTGTPTDSVADAGIGINLSQVIRIKGGAGPLTYTSTGVSTYSASAMNWRNGIATKSWQVMINTTGYDSLFYSSIQKSSGNGPRDFAVRYKIGKLGTWALIPVDTIRIPPSSYATWPTNIMTDTLPIACNNTDSVFLSWVERDTMSVSGGSIANNRTSQIDNIKVWGRNISGVEYPVVTSATLNSLTSATVVFSEPVNAVTSQNIANYTGLGVTAAALTATKDTVNLTLAGLTNGDAYTLTIAHVHDTTSILADTMFVPQSFHFLYNNSIDTLVFTEINYHNPPHTGNTASDSLEFIELYNNSPSMTRVGGYKLTSSIMGIINTLYTFQAGTTIAPGTYTVLAKKASAVNSFYGITGTIQYANTGLSNNESNLTLVNTLAEYIDSVTYKSYAPWDTMADGYGPSLVLCNPGTTIAYNSDPANWLVANELVGSIGGVQVYGNPLAGCTTEGIKNISENTAGLNCYPNPTRNNLTIAPNAFANDLTMFDILGNVVFDKKNVSSTININTSGFNAGIYFIRVTYNDNKVASRKISIN